MALLEAVAVGYMKWTDLMETQDRVKVKCGRTGFWLGQLVKTEATGEETMWGLE